MTGFLILVTSCLILAFNLCLCAVTEIPQFTEKLDDADGSSVQYLFSPHLRTISVDIYKNNFENFKEVTHLVDIIGNINLKADILLGLYDVMSNAHHTDIPFHALELYNHIEAAINANSTILNSEKLNELQSIQNGLLFNTIVPKGSHIIESAVYIKGCSLEGTPAKKLLDMLLTTNETVSILTFEKMIANIRWSLPMKDLIEILAKLSPHSTQNVDLLLSLYDEGPFDEAEQSMIFSGILQLQKKSLYEIMATDRMKQKVNAIIEVIPIELQHENLLSGKVCLFQKLQNGKRMYIHRCESDWMCAYGYDKAPHKATLGVGMQKNPLRFHFQILYYSDRAMCIKPGEFEQGKAYDDYNIYSSNKCELDFDWKVQFEDDYVLLQNSFGTRYLCADPGQYAYTRNHESFLSHSIDCKWYVEDCSQF